MAGKMDILGMVRVACAGRLADFKWLGARLAKAA